MHFGPSGCREEESSGQGEEEGKSREGGREVERGKEEGRQRLGQEMDVGVHTTGVKNKGRKQTCNWSKHGIYGKNYYIIISKSVRKR